MTELRRIAAFTSLLCLLALPARAEEPATLAAQVVHVHDNRVYLATSLGTLTPGDQLTFLARGKSIATAQVTQVMDGEIASATLVTGSLAQVKKLADLTVRRDRPAVRAPARLRVGYPSGGRDNLLVACEHIGPASFTSLGFRADTLGGHSFRLTRESAAAAGSVPWPDTVLVRVFDESIDEEIALERGELDVAVFWPGELSPHMREHPRWRAPLAGTRGVLGVSAAGVDTASTSTLSGTDSAALMAMSASLFRGDLVPLAWSRGAATLPPAARFEADMALPGHGVIAGYLDRGRPSPAPDPRRVVRLFLLPATTAGAHAMDESAAAPADTSAGAGANTGATADSIAATALARFAIRCPILCGATLRPYLSALGPDALVGIECRP